MIMIYMAAIDTNDSRQKFEQIYKDNRDIMYGYAYRILGDTASAEDAVHDAFLSFAKNFGKYESMDCNQTRSYLIITVKNASFKIYNKRKREVAAEEIYSDEVLPDIALDAESRDIKQIIFDMVKALDSKYADVILLKYYCDLSVSEIALTLGITQDNVKVRLHRARTLLKSRLKEGGVID